MLALPMAILVGGYYHSVLLFLGAWVVTVLAALGRRCQIQAQHSYRGDLRLLHTAVRYWQHFGLQIVLRDRIAKPTPDISTRESQQATTMISGFCL